MKITFDKDADALYFKLTDKNITETEEIEENIIVDYDTDKNIVGIEVLYFVEKHRKDFVSVFKQVVQSVLKMEELELV